MKPSDIDLTTHFPPLIEVQRGFTKSRGAHQNRPRGLALRARLGKPPGEAVNEKPRLSEEELERIRRREVIDPKDATALCTRVGWRRYKAATKDITEALKRAHKEKEREDE